MQSDDSFLKLFVVSNMMKGLIDVIFKLLLVVFLFVQILSQILDLVGQAFLSHSQIINNQSKVLVDSVEMLQLLSHFVSLFIELLDLKFSWSNISLQLLDLVI